MGPTDPASIAAHAREIAEGKRFGFGDNWSAFAEGLSDADIAVAVASLREAIPMDQAVDHPLRGMTVLDAGCGSGLFLLAALRLGATVSAFDYDPASVATTRATIERHATDEEAGRITIGHGSVLDPAFLRSLGSFDVVYSWGVLHHTGDMWDACGLVATRVRPGGVLVIALYNDVGFISRVWWGIKRLYVALPALLRPVLAVIVLVPIEAFALVRAAVKLRPASYIERWTAYGSRRGMDRWRDHLDWVGGFPYEYATRASVISEMDRQGFVSLRTREAIAWGNNEFTFLRRPETAASE